VLKSFNLYFNLKILNLIALLEDNPEEQRGQLDEKFADYRGEFHSRVGDAIWSFRKQKTVDTILSFSTPENEGRDSR